MWLYLDTFERIQDPFTLVRDVPANALPLGLFYFRMPSWGDRTEQRDKAGVLVSDFDQHHIRGTSGQHYMPINIAQYGIHQYDRWLLAATNAEKTASYASFLAQAHWLLEQQVQTSAGGVWHFHFSLGNQYDLRPPWVSCLAQGEGISLLCRAYQETCDQRYLDAACAAARPFGVSFTNGGVRSVARHGIAFYEEYPTHPPHHVLNGAMVAMFGLVDLHRLTGDSMIGGWLDEGLCGLCALLPAFDTGWWSRYSLSPRGNLANHYRLAAPHYHCMHIAELKALGRATGYRELSEVADRWRQYTANIPVTTLMNVLYSSFKRGVGMRNAIRARSRSRGHDTAVRA